MKPSDSRASVGDEHVTMHHLKNIDIPPTKSQNNPVMKPIYSYALLAALAAASPALAVDAVTTPVGYVTLDVAASSDSILGSCLNRPSVLTTTASATTASTSITLKATGVAADLLTYAAGVQSNHYYLLFKSGSLAGQYVKVVSNAASSDNGTPLDASDDTVVLTLDTAVTTTGTTPVEVRPFWTLDTLFPGGAGVGTQDDPGSTNQNVSFFDQSSVGVNLGTVPADTYSYYDGSQGGDAGWYGVNSGSPAGDTVIDNDQLLSIRNLSAVDREVVITGEVPSVGITSVVYREADYQDNARPFRFPVDVALADSGLCTATPDGLGGYTFSGPVSPVDDPGSTSGDSILVYDYFPVGEDGTPTATDVNFNAEKVYVFYDGSQGGAAEWYNVNTGSPENPMLKAGRGFYVRKAPGAVAAIPWVQPIPYTL